MTATEQMVLALDRLSKSRAAEIARLVPLAQELALRAGRDGITVANLRIAAVQRGLLSGDEKGRALSYLGVVLKKAGLHNTGRYRRSGIEKTHGNLNVIYVHPGVR